MTGDESTSPNNANDGDKPGEDKPSSPQGPKKAPISFGGQPSNSEAWNVVPSPSTPTDTPKAQPLKTPTSKASGKAPLSPLSPAPSDPKTSAPAPPSSSSEPKPREPAPSKPKAKPSVPPTAAKKKSTPKSEASDARPKRKSPAPAEAKPQESKAPSSAKKAKPKTASLEKKSEPSRAPDAVPPPVKKKTWHPEIPAIQKQTPAAPLVDAEPEAEKSIVEKARSFAFDETPAWAVSLVIHFAIVLLLALFTVATYQQETHTVEATYSEELGEQLEYEILVLDSQEFEVDANSGSLESLIETQEMPLPRSLMNVDLVGSEAARLADQESPGVDLKARGDGATRRAMLKAYGGNATTEQAVAAALDWLKRNQMQDGSWSLKGNYPDGSSIENKVSATAMALLAFQGAGHTDRAGTHAKTVAKGWRYLLRQLDADGSFLQGGAIPNQHRPYTQAQATIALCELYAMTGDAELRPKAQAAINYAVAWQAPEGGWRYTPGVESDLSVTGWFLMALQSARMGALDVPEESLANVDRFLETVASSPNEGQKYAPGSRYQYRDSRAERATPTMTAEGLLCRQYLGWNQDDPRLLEGMDYLLDNPIQWNEPNVYYWYYATQVAHHMEGDSWRNWNKEMRQIIPENQVQRGREKGSWDPARDENGVKAGRLFMTCLCTYMLEVYYRHLPIYSKHQLIGG